MANNPVSKAFTKIATFAMLLFPNGMSAEEVTKPTYEYNVKEETPEFKQFGESKDVQYKEYSNEQYSKMIRTGLQNKNMSSDVKQVVEEIFLRRAYELGLTDEEFENDFLKFRANVSSISFLAEEEMGNPNFGGHYNHYLKEIAINKDQYMDLYNHYANNNIYIKRFKEDFIGMIGHEIGHAASENHRKGTYGVRYLKGKDENGDNIYGGGALDEAFIERIAHDTIRGTKENTDVIDYVPETQGYTSITFMPSMLATTFGVSEKELLKASTKGREEFLKTLLGYEPEITHVEDEKDIEKISDEKLKNFFKIEENLNRLYNINYGDIINVMSYSDEEYIANYGSGHKHEQIIRNVRRDSLIGMYSVAFSELNRQIENTQGMDLENMDSYLQYMTYRRDRLEGIMDKSLIINNISHNLGNRQKVDTMVNPHKEILNEKLGNSHTNSDEYNKNMMKRDYEFKQWDNNNITNIAGKIFEKEVMPPKENIVQKVGKGIGQFFTNLFKKEDVKMLNLGEDKTQPESKKNVVEIINSFDEKYKVDAKDILPIHNQNEGNDKENTQIIKDNSMER